MSSPIIFNIDNGNKIAVSYCQILVKTNPFNLNLLKALIIDDEIDICYLLSSILKNRNLQADYVNSIYEARMALQLNVPSIIFLDNHLPDGLGIDFLKHIKQEYPQVKVIMITAHDNAEDRKKAHDIGVDSFIGKPFNREVIHRTLEELA